METYVEAALRERTCREYFQKIKKSNLNVDEKDHNGRPIIYKDVGFEETFEVNSLFSGLCRELRELQMQPLTLRNYKL